MTKAEPVIAGQKSIRVNLEAGKNYFFCTCGRSKKQPFCDGSHSGTEFTPQTFKVKKDGEYPLCACKRSAKLPFCDGSHKELPPEKD